jgi:hypothetical protein
MHVRIGMCVCVLIETPISILVVISNMRQSPVFIDGLLWAFEGYSPINVNATVRYSCARNILYCDWNRTFVFVYKVPNGRLFQCCYRLLLSNCCTYFDRSYACKVCTDNTSDRSESCRGHIRRDVASLIQRRCMCVGVNWICYVDFWHSVYMNVFVNAINISIILYSSYHVTSA